MESFLVVLVSVNYKFRIAFRYVPKNEVLFLDIGDHDICK